MLPHTLKECKSEITSLNLVNNYLDDDCMEALGQFIENSNSIEEISLGNFEKTGQSKISDSGIKILSEHLIGNTTLRSLAIYDCDDITDISVPYFIEIAKRSCVTSLDLQCLPISDEELYEIYELCKISIDQREVPVKSNAKSAAKIDQST